LALSEGFGASLIWVIVSPRNNIPLNTQPSKNLLSEGFGEKKMKNQKKQGFNNCCCSAIGFVCFDKECDSEIA